jgi:CTP synthase
MARYIFVTGGVVSSLGKGLTSASLAYLLQSRGFKVRIKKLDPYLNVDPGTMSPFQHGEVFVTDDGAETDLDLGHYERFSGITAKQSDNITTGKIYSDVLKKERKGKFLGKTVQVIPHITDRIKEFIKQDIKNEDFVICEIGGTVGDIESLPFIEAIRQFSNDVGKKNTLFIHLTFVPYLRASDEIKTKPTQHSVKELRSIGIQPDIIICRSEQQIPLDQRKKISLFCNVPIESVIQTIDVKTIYEAPISFNKEKLDKEVLKYFKIKSKKNVNLNPWKKITKIVLNTKKSVDIAIIGKYVNLKDAYKSLDEALTHGGIKNNLKVNLIRIESDNLKAKEIKNKLKNVSGILIPGGFGKRGTEGKIEAIKYARTKKIKFHF